MERTEHLNSTPYQKFVSEYVGEEMVNQSLMDSKFILQ